MCAFICALSAACGDLDDPSIPPPAPRAEAIPDKTGITVSEAQAVGVAKAFLLGQTGCGYMTRSATEALMSKVGEHSQCHARLWQLPIRQNKLLCQATLINKNYE